MKINKLIITNLGLYSGKRVFDFSSATAEKPIILFGGLNGAGKTTLFDSFRLCLYGREIFKRISEADYLSYLKDKIHSSVEQEENCTDASIGIEFEYAEEGTVNTYYVERAWADSDSVTNKKGNGVTNSVAGGANKVTELLTVFKNNETLEDIHAESWQDFIKELIPIGVSQLFFFDGEKIQNIISNNNNQEFKNSVKALLGIDIIERLQADIKIYQGRKLKDVSSLKEQQRLEEIELSITSVETKITRIKDDNLGDLENKLLIAQNELKNCKDKVSAEGGAFYSQKEELRGKKNDADRELETVKVKLQELATDGLPLLIADKLSKRLAKQLVAEEELSVDRATSNKLMLKQQQLFDLINSTKSVFADLDDIIKQQLKDECLSIFNDDQPIELVEIFEYSPAQVSSLIAAIDQVVQTKKQVHSASSEYERVFRKLQSVQRDIDRAPDDDLVKTLYDRLAEHSETVGIMMAEKSKYEEQITLLDQQLADLSNEQAKVYDRIAASEKNDRKLALTERVSTALLTYKCRLAETRIDQLKKEFLAAFNELHRKDDVVDRLDIHPESLAISMYDKKGDQLSVEKLSSGEKEIYAISLLSALAKTSGMNLPFIIDTPLGRLDTEHRNSLVHKFFPNISHQMVIFSTDTEIGKEYYKDLEPHICATYKLGYDNVGKSTQVEEGYFWK